MTRDQLEHILRAAATITGCEEIVVVGSQAILGEHPDAPAEMRVSNEADVYPRARPELASLIDGAIGELSAFHDTFRYYAEAWAQKRRPCQGAGSGGLYGSPLALRWACVRRRTTWSCRSTPLGGRRTEPTSAPPSATSCAG